MRHLDQEIDVHKAQIQRLMQKLRKGKHLSKKEYEELTGLNIKVLTLRKLQARQTQRQYELN